MGDKQAAKEMEMKEFKKQAAELLKHSEHPRPLCEKRNVNSLREADSSGKK